MSTFEEVVDDLAGQVDAGWSGDPDVGYGSGAYAMRDAVKQAAADGEFRIDQDRPDDIDAYVIRIEAADGRRLLTKIPKAKARADGNELLRQIVTGAAGIATMMLTGQGILTSVEIDPAPSRLVLP